ncbi:PREDICTED: citrate lyase subunit beta-like protein, mitochondrial [Amphimedon queenslandica]|uniref:HpcH/HpaI aldolase/citrate lyase domain-containing protein n=1 Tax=Amphimedon queenslandica TaxID=400682 RepID=A0A1X7TWR7_AMPQE|nr:PREDICTED: citrate lyase subunit beta-like protein, mitochondrial [Amphimedon queenslandica]|eukprot:XP_003389593.1 PREDICTED: citrate lyase subunit beta-like protein, mitochondrial [Amphimedon queenslandica]
MVTLITGFSARFSFSRLCPWHRLLSTGADIDCSSSNDGVFFPRRALMYIPGSDVRKLNKIPTLGVDTVAIDLEDGVAANQKEAARSNLPLALSLATQGNSEVLVRINDMTSGHVKDDLKAIFAHRIKPHGIMLPKCESKEDLKILDFLVGFYTPPDAPIPSLHIMMESISSLLSIRDTCSYGLHRLKHLVLESVTFGSEDYLASLGIHDGEESHLLAARQSFVTQVKSLGLQALDSVSVDYKDIERLKLKSEDSARMGFTGKQVIHPGQIDVVQSAYSPSPESIEWAEELIRIFKEHQQFGKGAFTYKGKMIDRPILLQAENILKMKKALRKD